MKENKNRQWQALFLGSVVLAAACSKEEDEPSILAENQQLSVAERAIQQQDADKYSAEYFESNNQKRVGEENNIIDDLNADTKNGKK